MTSTLQKKAWEYLASGALGKKNNRGKNPKDHLRQGLEKKGRKKPNRENVSGQLEH